jgi:hypothetical protein
MRSIILGTALCCACGGSAAPNPFNISGSVILTTDVNGGSLALVLAEVSRPLPDGGFEAALDANLALNGVPLGHPSSVGALKGQPASFVFAGASFPGTVPGAHQTLSVIGANPPAQIAFDCPAAMSFLSPAPGAVLDRSQPVILAWTPGANNQYLSYSFSTPDSNLPSIAVFPFGLDAGVTSTDFLLSPDVPEGSNVQLTISANGNTPDPFSVCTFSASVDVVFP